MYDWIDKTRNFIAGECPHKCGYCYVKRLRFPLIKEKYSGELRLIESELERNEGEGKTIFVQDCGDLFAKEVPYDWIRIILRHLGKFHNTYLFQTKNPERLKEFMHFFPANSIFGTTIETNRAYEDTKAPNVQERQYFIEEMPERRMVSIEPVMEFDLDIMVKWMEDINPEFISIGADSGGNNLKEPSKEKLEELIKELSKFTEVKVKSNMQRLLK